MFWRDYCILKTKRVKNTLERLERGWQRKKEGEREEGKINRGLGEAERDH